MGKNYASKFSKKVAERFTHDSYVQGIASDAYEFEGVRIVKIYSEDTFDFVDYTRTGSDRYGAPHDQTDSLQELEMTQDKGVSIIIDKGEDIEKMNTQGANRQFRREMDEKAIPMVDKYAFKAWTKGAGSVVALAAALNANTALNAVMDMTEKLDDAFAPESGRTMFVTTEGYKYIKQSPQFIYTDKLAQDSLVKGQVGMVDNFKVVKVSKKYLPDNVYALAVHRSAILNPVKLKDYNLHKNPPGVSGDRIDIRMIYDAFVIDSKARAVCALVASNSVCAEPTITIDTNANTFAIAGTFDKLFYTLDGSDPRCSGTAIAANANVSATALNGATHIRAVAYDANKAVAYREKEASV